MTKKDWKKVTQVHILVEKGNSNYSFPINCPRWLFNILRKLEI